MNVLEEVYGLISEVLNCNINELNIESGLGHHYAWDSLMHVAIIIAIEKRFNVIVNENSIGELTSIGRIVDFININGDGN